MMIPDNPSIMVRSLKLFFPSIPSAFKPYTATTGKTEGNYQYEAVVLMCDLYKFLPSIYHLHLIVRCYVVK